MKEVRGPHSLLSLGPDGEVVVEAGETGAQFRSVHPREMFVEVSGALPRPPYLPAPGVGRGGALV